jgi:secreted PhoX family phosphatase
MTDLHPADAPSADELPGDTSAHTRRGFIRGVAIAGASTMAIASLDAAGVTDLMGESAVAAGAPTPFSDFRALGASAADRFEVPEGFRADVLISWGDEFENTDGTKLRYGFNNDFLAFMPLKGKDDEALLFVNHEYPAPFFQHGNSDPKTKTAAQVEIEKESVGNSILHVERDAEGVWKVVSPSPYNRRITGSTPTIQMTGPLPGKPQLNSDGTAVVVETTAAGSLANCSGGITPWGTALSCEENYDGYYGDASTQQYGWKNVPGNEKYDEKTYAHYGWVVEHDPYDASSTPRKHTALGRFRHENTAFRHVAGKRFVLYMGDDKVNEGVYKFVSSRKFVEGNRAENLKILTEGQLFIAKWSPEGRRRFANKDGSGLLTATSGRGEWVLVNESELVDTSGHLRKRFGADFDKFFGTNRPEDVEVDADGTVLIAFTNNSGVNDRHGAIRKLREDNNDPTAASFVWEDYAEGGQTGRADVGEQGFSSCDNLCFDDSNNLWVVTDISSSSLNNPTSAPYYAYHGNNAVFMIPRSGPNAGIAYRFANMPIDAEGTGPYFSADGTALFINVQHPGEETPAKAGATYGKAETYTSYWPDGDKTANQTPSLPRPSTVVITRIPEDAPDNGGTPTIPDPKPGQPGQPGTPGQPGKPVTGKTSVDVPETVSYATLAARGVTAKVHVREAARIELKLRIRLPKVGRSKGRVVTAATAKKTVGAGSHSLRLRPGTLARTALRTRKGKTMRAEVTLEVRPVDGSPKKLRRSDAFRIR